jgi:signal transduction histidine kinase
MRFGLPLGIVAAVGVVDYVASAEIQFALFYLIAVALATWTVGRGFGVLVSVLSLGAWLLGDVAIGASPRLFVAVWNATIVFGFYLVVVALLGRVRDMTSELEGRVHQRTVALTEEMVERQRLERELLDTGERERRRIGRDLHDSLGQLLTGTALAGQVLHERLLARGLDEAEDASRVVGLVEEAIEQTRSLSRGLDPVELEGGGLDQGLRELAMSTSAHPSVRCEYHCPGPIAIRDQVTAVHLYRISQEAITNAIRHGRASHIALRLESLGAGVRLVVDDDGSGLPPPGRRGPGMGLRIMAHRAAMMNGTLELRARPGGGATVICELPEP